MNVKIEGSNLSVNIHNLMTQLSTEDKLRLCEMLACEDDIIKHVVSQIITGWTNNASHGANDSHEPDPRYPLGIAIRHVALSADTIAARQVEELTAAMRRQYAYHDQINVWACKMYDAMATAMATGIAAPVIEPPSLYDAKPDAYIVVKNENQGRGILAEEA